MHRVSGAVLVGGKSRRMGMDKALLTVGGVPIVQRVARALRSVSDDVFLVGRGAEQYPWLGLRGTHDLIPDAGPLGGIHTALRVAGFPYCVIAACDMPFLSPSLLRHMVRMAEGWDVLVPRVDDHLEPLLAVYSRACLEPIEGMLKSGQLCPLDLYPLVRTRYLESEAIARLDPDFRSFRNLNTPEDLAQAQLAVPAGPHAALASPTPKHKVAVAVECQIERRE